MKPQSLESIALKKTKDKKNRVLGFTLAFIATASWSGFHIVSRAVFGENPNSIDPVFGTFIRFLMSSAFFILLLALSGRIPEMYQSFSKNIGTFLLLGLVGIVGDGVLLFWAAKHTTAARCSLGANLSPVFTIIIAWFFAGEKITRYKIIGMILGFIGMFLTIQGKGGQDVYTDASSVFGDLLAIGSGICWAAYTVGGLRVIRRYGATISTAIVIISGTGMLFLLTILTKRPMQWKMPLNVLLAYAYLGVFASGISYLFWYTSLKHLKASEAGAFGYISIVLSIIFSCIFLKESFTLSFALAFACVIGGVYLIMDKEKEKAAP